MPNENDMTFQMVGKKSGWRKKIRCLKMKHFYFLRHFSSKKWLALKVAVN